MRTAIVSTYPPRACGIGTFAADLRATLLESVGIQSVELVAVVNAPSSPQQHDLLATIVQEVRGDYIRTARMLGRLDVDVVLLEHEYGIFGGRDGDYVLSLAKELSQPLVVTLHTVLSEPSPHQAKVLSELCTEAELVIVMTETALRLLVASGTCPGEKIRVVPHGAPARLTSRAADELIAPRPGAYRVDDGRFLISTFGLISPGKGLETVIESLPAVIERHPEVVYVIAGRTHPDVAHREGERYRVMLERRVHELGLRDHVDFDDRFLTIRELSDLLAATRVFVTPYHGREQIASGALTFAIAAGCAVVSTPYWYAQDMLASGAGQLVPFKDTAAIADAVCAYVEQPEALAAARAEADEANRTKSDFLATMSHELRTPLNAIVGYAQLLEVGVHGALSHDQAVDVARILRSSHHLLGLINDLLNFAKVESGQLQLRIREIELSAVIEEVEDLIRPQSREKRLGYTFDNRCSGARVRADRDKVAQVFANLLTNAIQFTPAGGNIAVVCTADERWVSTEIRDTGIGIAPDKLEAIFEPFVQLALQYSGERQGTGLGLAITRELVLAMGGDVSVRSEPGVGSTFTVRLPRA